LWQNRQRRRSNFCNEGQEYVESVLMERGKTRRNSNI
jgi:hypothetical protein